MSSKFYAQDSNSNSNSLLHHGQQACSINNNSNNNTVQSHHHSQQPSIAHHPYHHRQKPHHQGYHHSLLPPPIQPKFGHGHQYNNNYQIKQTSLSQQQGQLAKHRVTLPTKSIDSESSIMITNHNHHNVGRGYNENPVTACLEDTNSQDISGPLIENEEELTDTDQLTEKYLETRSLYNSSWIFSEDFLLTRTPSRRHGISYSEEIEFRRKGTTFIRDLTKLLKIKSICKETAFVYFHRFFLLRSFKHYEPRRIAMACLYFACKYEDHPLLKDHLIQVSYLLFNKIVEKQSAHNKLNKDDKEYIEYSDRLILDENCLLQALGFELHVRHFQVLVVENYSKRPIQGTTQELYTSAYQIASELNRLTTLCLEYNAPILAAVSIYLAARFKMVTLPDDWCQSFMMADSFESVHQFKNIVIKIGEQYKEILTSFSQLVRKMLSDEYIRQNGSNLNKCIKNPNNNNSNNNKAHQQQQQNQLDNNNHKSNSNLLLLNNFSPDSAYSSSSSNAAAYSPTETIITPNTMNTTSNSNKNINNRVLAKASNNNESTSKISNKFDSSSTTIMPIPVNSMDRLQPPNGRANFENNQQKQQQHANNNMIGTLNHQTRTATSYPSTSSILNNNNSNKRDASIFESNQQPPPQQYNNGQIFNDSGNGCNGISGADDNDNNFQPDSISTINTLLFNNRSGQQQQTSLIANNNNSNKKLKSSSYRQMMMAAAATVMNTQQQSSRINNMENSMYFCQPQQQQIHGLIQHQQQQRSNYATAAAASNGTISSSSSSSSSIFRGKN